MGAATPAERQELLELIRMPGHAAVVKDLIGEEMERLEIPVQEMEWQLPEENAEQLLANILRHPVETPVRPMAEEERRPMAQEAGRPMAQQRKSSRWLWQAAAAILFLAAGIGGYRHWSERRQNPVARVKSTPLQDVLPGSNKATLTLANGATILLDSARSGPLAQQGGVSVVKPDSGKLTYSASQGRPNEVLYNQLTTPRGGQYQLTLPDGSRVWLNAASSIRYPTAFIGQTREVEISGEAYFEIEKNTKMPFVVKAGQTHTTVLGTSFNINAYGDEDRVITTLLEGAVKFGNGHDEKLLHPGQQAILQESTKRTQEATGGVTVQDADTWQAVAWKNGQFDFDNKNLSVILRQISRWYDVDVSYPSTNDGTKFGGGISRRLNLSHVLRLLEMNGVHTRLEGRKIIVLP